VTDSRQRPRVHRHSGARVDDDRSATLENDGVRYHYQFANRSRIDYDMMQAVTDPRMISPYFHDTRLERTWVHHRDGFDLLASETPSRATMPLSQWLPNRYRVSYTWPVEAHRIEKKEDGITWYNKSRTVDEPFLATQSTDKQWIFATFSRDPGNLWTNPELTCQHADPSIELKAGTTRGYEVKTLLIKGTLEDVLRKVREDSLRRDVGGGDAAVDQKCRAVDVGRFVARQE
jgi:hypothetical protein